MTTLDLDYVRSKIDAAAYWAATSAKLSIAEFCNGNRSWEVQFMEAVHSGFWRLHNLDRSSPFWAGTNGLATKSKLSDFANYELATNPRSIEAARLAIAMGLLQGSGHLEAAPWRALADAGAADFQFLVASAFATSPYWAGSNVEKISSLVRTLQIHREVEAALQVFGANGEEQAEWVERVKHALAA